MVMLVVPLEKSVFIRFQMRDPHGKEVEKTAECKEWGADVKHFPAKPDRMSHWQALGSHTNGTSMFINGPALPSPNALFVMKESGIYYLTMEIHLMKQRMIPGGWTWNHIAIPPVTIKVEKPQTKDDKP